MSEPTNPIRDLNWTPAPETQRLQMRTELYALRAQLAECREHACILQKRLEEVGNEHNRLRERVAHLAQRMQLQADDAVYFAASEDRRQVRAWVNELRALLAPEGQP